MLETVTLCFFAALAGFIDSIAGGGGLIQLPALFIVLPHLPIATLLGTNKLAAISGTSVATLQYARHVRIDWKATLPATAAALIASFLGARTVTLVNPGVMRPLILFMLIAIALYTFLRRDFGSIHAPRLDQAKSLAVSITTGALIGFYDGFFGPGTGSFLIFVFIGIFGFNFLSASASSKVVNFATNISAVLYFAATGNIIYTTAILMGLANILGAVVGSRLAILKGNRFVRIFFLVVVVCLIAKLGYDMLLK
ncbi:MAG: TSUP family transporter [Syntrophorhabdus sp.]|nr:TSUP family transporter [Syntrophorhabdus sp.]